MATRKIEKFNASKFLAHAHEVREQAVDLLANEDCVKDIRQAYRIVMDEDEYMETSYVTVANTADDLRASLVTASIAAGQYGASEAQINYIVALAEKTGDFSPVDGRLTKSEASNIIDQMKREAARA